MDGERFDAITRQLVGGNASRRATLRLLAGGALGSVAGLFGFRGAGAACRLVDQSCDAERRCCKGARCANGRCECKENRGWFACRGTKTRCVNTNTSEQFCGGCTDAACGTLEVCVGGRCAPTGACTTSYVCGGGIPFCGPSCACIRSVEGPIVCAGDAPTCGPPCEKTADCAEGEFCQKAGTGCCGQTCFPLCGASTTAAAAEAATGPAGANFAP
jgi:hypothetical protein